MKKTSLVVVGNGMATGRLLDELAKRDFGAFSITVIGDEGHGCYNRIMLSPVLAGEITPSAIIDKPSGWYQKAGIRFVSGVRVQAINPTQKCVMTEQGDVFDYDELVLATGSRPAAIPAANQRLNNIYSFRTLDDVDRIMASASSALDSDSKPDRVPHAHAVVVGGGLLGLEAAYGLAQRGLAVTLVHRGDWLLNRQLDKPAAALLQTVMQEKNVRFKLGCEVSRFDGVNDVCGAELNNGDYLECSLAVVATGITPNKELGLAAGLQGARGIAVNEYMQTSDLNISAIGECVEFNDATFGLVEPIWRQCVTLADRLASNKMTPFCDSPVATKLKVSGVQLFSAGDYLTTPAHRELVYSDSRAGVYRKILIENGRIAGIVLFGDVRDGQEYFAMMHGQRGVTEVAPVLLLGKAFYQSELEAIAA